MSAEHKDRVIWDEDISSKRHGLTHVMAQAMQRTVDPKLNLGVGPYIDNGFYHDFLLSDGVDFGEGNLKELSKAMVEICKEKQKHYFLLVPVEKALQIQDDIEQPMTKKILQSLIDQGETQVSYYINTIPKQLAENRVKGKHSEYHNHYEKIDSYMKSLSKDIPDDEFVSFVNMCKGPHLQNRGDLPFHSFKLERVAGAYWLGDEKNPMMTRIYGIAFESKEELKEHMTMMEEAKKRDHRTIGKKMDLFTFSNRVGAGLPMFLPNGETIKFELEKYMREEKIKLGYKFVTIPHIAKRELYETSGHMGKYDAMMPSMTDKEGSEFVMKAMNCPHHFELYNARPHSYKELPLRYAENTTCYRNEKTGELSGLTRVKSLTQDDTHHFVRHDQIEQEIQMILGLMERVYTTFGFNEFKVEISVRDPKHPENYFGDDDVRNKSEETLIKLVKKRGVSYTVEEGEAAFYGPKIDIRVKDAIGRDWQLTTVQLDFIQPENFDMTYTNEEGETERPAVLHVAILGSSHRFMGVLIEHFAGVFPVRLAPIQAKIIPVAETFNTYAKDVADKLKQAGIRVEIDDSNDSFSKKIRNGEMMKIPYLLVVGEQEQGNQSVNVRSYKTKRQDEMKSDAFVEQIAKEYKERSL